jgi:hypothetical protein
MASWNALAFVDGDPSNVRRQADKDSVLAVLEETAIPESRR